MGKIADFGHNEGKGFEKRAARPHTIVLAVTPSSRRAQRKIVYKYGLLTTVQE